MPVRSTGCKTCRKRKIRCDEERPGCRRCATHGVPCPGYRGDGVGGIEFEDQTSITVKRVSAKQSKQALSLVGRGSAKSAPNSIKSFSNPELEALQVATRHINDYPPLSFDGSVQAHGYVLTALPAILRSPPAERMQLYDHFISGYLPQDPGKSSMHFDYLRLLVNTRTPHSSLIHGLDALCLVHKGSQTNNQDLVQQAIRAYGMSLTDMAKAIAEKKAVEDDSILAAATVLSVCEFYDDIKMNGLGWIGHQNGLTQLLAARGPSSLKSDLALMLFYNARYGALAHGLIKRKAQVFAQPAWRACAFRVPVPDISTNFYDCAIQLPGLLERHDFIDVTSPTASQTIDQLLVDCQQLEFSLRNWETGWCTRFRLERREPYWEVSIEDFTVLPRLVRNRQLREAYRFHRFLEAYMFIKYWQVMHCLRECIESLQDKRRKLDPLWVPSPGTEVTVDELNEYVFHVCRSLPYFTEPETSVSGHIAIFLPLRVIAFHFKKRGMWQWLRWTWAVRECIFTKGVSQPNVGDSQGIATAQKQVMMHVLELESRKSSASTTPSSENSISLEDCEETSPMSDSTDASTIVDSEVKSWLVGI